MPQSSRSLPTLCEAPEPIPSHAKREATRGIQLFMVTSSCSQNSEEMGCTETVCTSSNLMDLQIIFEDEGLGT